MKLDDPSLKVETSRLWLEPVMESHASEMYALLSEPSLFQFVPHNPPANLSELKTQYRKWESRKSPSGGELWLNWIGRLKSAPERPATHSPVIGHFQVGLDPQGCAFIAYSVGSRFQRQGFALEATTGLIEFLDTLGARRVRASVDTRNVASIALLKRLGLCQIEFIRDADRFKGATSDEYVFEITLRKGQK